MRKQEFTIPDIKHIDAIAELIKKQVDGEVLTDVEVIQLNNWKNTSEENTRLYEQLNDYSSFREFLQVWNSIEAGKENKRSVLMEKIRTDAAFLPLERPAHRVHFLKSAWFRYAAAIIIIFGISAYLLTMRYMEKSLITQTQPVPPEKDLLPGKDKAILTLADGKQIQLDSNANALLAEKGISNSDALIVYSGKGETSVMNTLATPKGGQYKIKLSDGTMVWLNAASSITYPTSFTGKNREVNITGEVYFDVAKNKGKPFIVSTAKEVITVLGTSFNVNRYEDEPAGKITLVDGAVKVNDVLLQPGQAYVKGKIITTNINQDVAWKNGAFDFNNLTLEQAARQIGRWYDVEIKFEGAIPKTEIYGGVSRSVTLQRLIQGMEGEFAHFDLQGKVLVIKSL